MSKIVLTQLNKKYKNLCDPVAVYIKEILQDVFSFAVDEFNWKFNEEFYKGEFVLCLMPIATRKKYRHPVGGTYLYYFNAINSIQELLCNDKFFLNKVFNENLKSVLQIFDDTAQNLINPGCFGQGFSQNATKTTFKDDIVEKI